MIFGAEFCSISGVIEGGVCSRALPGESESGDLHLVAPFPGGVLVAVADGLGHGSEAAAAARIAVTSLRECPGLAAPELMRRCHAALHKSRGAVLGLASIDAGRNQLSWIGIGNVEATLLHAGPAAPALRETLPNRGGVVGHQMPSLRVTTHRIGPGDFLILATDGIESTFRMGEPVDWQPQDLARYIVGRHAKVTDDALALVVRYVGLGS
jgi:phosphoserine phosphatase RsbX